MILRRAAPILRPTSHMKGTSGGGEGGTEQTCGTELIIHSTLNYLAPQPLCSIDPDSSPVRIRIRLQPHQGRVQTHPRVGAQSKTGGYSSLHGEDDCRDFQMKTARYGRCW